MGFFNKLMGGGKSDKKEQIRNIFNSKVNNGEEYSVIAAMNMVQKHTILKETRTFYNYIIGYMDADDPEIVIIPVDSELSDIGDPVSCKKSECRKSEYLEKTGSFTVTHPDLGAVDFSVIASAAWGGYIISVSYADEFYPFMDFYKNRFAK